MVKAGTNEGTSFEDRYPKSTKDMPRRETESLPEGESWEPPGPTDGPHAKGNIQAWTVAKEGGEDGFETEAKVQWLVRHSLLENRVLTRLRDDQIRPLSMRERGRGKEKKDVQK